jgi:hypothetical protein
MFFSDFVDELRNLERKDIIKFIDSITSMAHIRSKGKVILSQGQLVLLIESMSLAGLFDILSYIFEVDKDLWNSDLRVGKGFLEGMVEEMYDPYMKPRDNINNYFDIIKLLVRKNVYTITQDDLVMARDQRLDELLKILKRLRTEKVIPNLRQQIKDSYLKKEFNWQLICSKLNKEGRDDLIDLALGLEINVSSPDKMSKRELCKIISSEMFDIVESCQDSNLLGVELNELPKWRIFKIKGKCYDIIDLKKILDSGETRNPFTREELPEDEIMARINKIESMSIKGSIDAIGDNLFTRVKETPIFSQKEYLNQRVVKLFGIFPYMLEPSLIVKANDSEIDFMAEKLFRSEANEVLQVSSNEIKTIEELKGIGKKIAFVDVLINTDESKLVVLYDAFSYFSKRKSGQDLSDDRFLYMIGDLIGEDD